jgi:hypothetical protein
MEPRPITPDDPVGTRVSLSHGRCCGKPAEVLEVRPRTFLMQCACGAKLVGNYTDRYRIVPEGLYDPPVDYGPT